MNATIQKRGWMEKGASPRKLGVLRQIATHSNLSALHKASCINFFPSPGKKNAFCTFKWLRCCHDLGHPLIGPSIHPGCMCLVNVNDSSVSTLSQKGHRKRERWNNSVRAFLWKRWQCHLWRWVNGKHIQWNYKAFSHAPSLSWLMAVISVKPFDHI